MTQLRNATKKLLSLISSERGSAMLLSGIAMVVLVGFTALAVDGGYMYFRHTEIQDIADAAALAAAYELITEPGTTQDKQVAAFASAVECARRNGFSTLNTCGYATDVSQGGESGRMTVSFLTDPDEARVDITLNASTFFAKALSIGTAPMGVRAIAEVTSQGGSSGDEDLVPLAYFQATYKPGTKVQMTLAPGEGVKGNYAFLDFGSPCKFGEYLEEGYPGTVSMGDLVETYPGVSAGQVKHALADRLAGCTHCCSVTGSGPNLEFNITEPCPKVVIVPAVSGFHETCGKSYVTVTGFVKILIEDYNECSKVLTAWVLGQVAPGDFTGTSGLPMRSVRLK